ncbi:hypothetical protein JL722_10543 [Aureococcus anophagefferens]|nr:hypothetical protein JL722_10543 [Aureococcus anophagefferens]
MISRRLEMVERSVMQARVSDSGGGKSGRRGASRRKKGGRRKKEFRPGAVAPDASER